MSVWRVLLISALLLLNACSELENPMGVPMDDILRFESKTGRSMSADGVSTCEIEVKIPDKAAEKNRTVTFKTNLGAFLGTNNKQEIPVRADSKGWVKVILKAGTIVGTATVSASVADFVVTQDIEFLRAHASHILGETLLAIATLNGTKKPLLTAILSRDKGSVSQGTEVRFRATQTDSSGLTKDVGRFFDLAKAKTNNNGIATAQFAADTGDVTTDKPVTIKMTTDTDEGGELSFQLKLQVKEK